MPVGRQVGDELSGGIPYFPCLSVGVVGRVVRSRLHLKPVQPACHVKGPGFDLGQREVGLGHRVVKVKFGQLVALSGEGDVPALQVVQAQFASGKFAERCRLALSGRLGFGAQVGQKRVNRFRRGCHAFGQHVLGVARKPKELRPL